MGAVDIVFTILALVAAVLGCVILVYMVSLLFDNYSRMCRGRNYFLTPQELIERDHASALTKRAGLAGILPEERVRIYRHFFENRAMVHVPDDRYPTNETTLPASGDDDDMAVPDSKITLPKAKELSDSKYNSSMEATKFQDQALPLVSTELNEATCPICLSEYAKGDKVITGSSCLHKFHLECCMQWLEKGNDHCAYCRKDMMTPKEMTQVAREELGKSRVDKITHINEMAAQRLAEYQAALASGADNTEVSRQFASGNMPGDQHRALTES